MSKKKIKLTKRVTKKVAKVTKRKKVSRNVQPRPAPTAPDVVGEIAGEIHRFRLSILYFIKIMWGLVPQDPKPEYKQQWEAVIRAEGLTWLRLKETVTANWFGDPEEQKLGWVKWTWFNFVKGEHLSWQQTLILLGVEKARGSSIVSTHMSIKSGHGIGKSATVSWIVLWFLYCFYQSQIPVTAPTSTQMKDVLWKELSLWINRIQPARVKEVFEWQSDYVRMRYDPETWFARAKTSSKENTEALAGIHAEHVLIAVDEASGVPEQVFNTAEGALTSGNVFVIMISNPTRVIGYFYDSHNKNADDWQRFSFNCEEAPLVSLKYVERQAKRHGVESDEYRIRVKGDFPSEDMMDDSGYLQLVPRSKVQVEPSLGDGDKFIGKKILSIDPSGEGDDECEFVLRDQFRAKSILTLNTTNDKTIAEHVLTFASRYNLKSGDIVIEGFGKGTDVAKNVAISTQGKLKLYVVLPGNSPKDEERYNTEFFSRFPYEVDEKLEDIYLNLRALAHFRMREWCFAGGRIIDSNVENSEFGEQISVNRYKRSLQGNKIQMMPKQEMNKLRIKSPNKSDALMLSFLLESIARNDKGQSEWERQEIMHTDNSVDDPFGVL